MAEAKSEEHPLITSSVDVLGNPDETGTFTVADTGELVLDELAPLPLAPKVEIELGDLDLSEELKHHLLLLPPHVAPAELEALAISVWNEAGWLSPGELRLAQGATLQGPWTLTEENKTKLGLAKDSELTQAYELHAPIQRGSAPPEDVKRFSTMARAFPNGMPVGLEERVLSVLHQMARRLGGTIKVAGSEMLLTPDPESSVNLRVYASSWLSPEDALELMGPHLPSVRQAGPAPEASSGPYALLAPAGRRSQILIGVREEQIVPRALRWEMWAKEKVFLYEVIWAAPEDLMDLAIAPTRAGRLERRQATRAAETAAALLQHVLCSPQRGGAAIIDEDGFLVHLDAPLQEEASPHP